MWGWPLWPATAPASLPSTAQHHGRPPAQQVRLLDCPCPRRRWCCGPSGPCPPLPARCPAVQGVQCRAIAASIGHRQHPAWFAAAQLRCMRTLWVPCPSHIDRLTMPQPRTADRLAIATTHAVRCRLAPSLRTPPRPSRRSGTCRSLAPVSVQPTMREDKPASGARWALPC